MGTGAGAYGKAYLYLCYPRCDKILQCWVPRISIVTEIKKMQLRGAHRSTTVRQYTLLRSALAERTVGSFGAGRLVRVTCHTSSELGD